MWWFKKLLHAIGLFGGSGAVIIPALGALPDGKMKTGIQVLGVVTAAVAQVGKMLEKPATLGALPASELKTPTPVVKR